MCYNLLMISNRPCHSNRLIPKSSFIDLIFYFKSLFHYVQKFVSVVKGQIFERDLNIDHFVFWKRNYFIKRKTYLRYLTEVTLSALAQCTQLAEVRWNLKRSRKPHGDSFFFCSCFSVILFLLFFHVKCNRFFLAIDVFKFPFFWLALLSWCEISLP